MSSYPCFLPLNVASKYFGQWSSNLQLKTNHNVYFKSLQGESQVSFDNQSIFKGNLKNGIFQGKGSYVWPNGVRYDGDFKKSLMTGFGKFTWPNGSFYEGQLLESKRNGQGTFYCSDQGYVYVGQWKEGQKQGKGKIEYKDQSFYEGYFSKDKKNGFGKMTYVSRNEYEGQWKDDKKSGKGVMNWFNKHEKYVGQWKDDQPDGYGEYFWYENKVQYKIFKNMYKGYWKCGKRNGFGCFFYSNGYRYEGYFVNNLKQGWGILTDEYGISKASFFSNNRPNFIQQKKSLKALKQASQPEADKKLPSIAAKAHQKNPSDLTKQTLSKPSPMQNEYKRYIDFDHPEMNDNFYNMLLRNNSRLRNLYKSIGTSNITVKDYYSGMVLENYWRVLKQCKIISENYCSLVSIDRQFCKSRKFNFSVTLPNHNIVDTMESSPTEAELTIQYENVLWHQFFKQISQQSQLNWESFSLNQKGKKTLLPDFKGIDIHNPSSIILFRHFVCLIIHTANLLENSGKSLKQKIEWLITSLQHVNDNVKNQKCQDSLTQGGNKNVFVPDWAKVLHQELLTQLEGREKSIDGHIDLSLTVRKMYSVMDIGNIFKDQNQRILYLQKIQRYLNIKTSALKKQFRHLHSQLDKNIKINPNFNYLMNYQLNAKQINQFLFLCINKKVISHNQEDFQLKYKQTIRNLINEVAGLKKRGVQDSECIFHRKYSKSPKDIQKEALILAMEQQKIRKIQEEKVQKMKEREQKQILLMSKEDYDAEEIVFEKNDEENEYY